MALPQTVGFKAEAVDEERVWCACIVEEVNDDYVIVSFDGWNAEKNRSVCDPREIRDRTLPDRKRLLLLNITQTYVNKKLKLRFASILGVNCIIFHGRNIYEFQR